MALTFELVKDPQFCISQARCSLCRYGVSEREFIIASPMWSYQHSNDEKLVGATFTQGTVVRAANGRLCICGRETCHNRTEEIHCFHDDCYKFARRNFGTFDISPVFEAVSRFNFHPPLSGELNKQRDKRLEALIVRNIKKEPWPKHFPNELWLMIARYLLRECAMSTALQQAITPPSHDSFINLSRDVYAQYVMFDGTFYLKGLENSDSPVGGAKLLSQGNKGRSKVRKIYIVEDHLGIRNIEFLSQYDAKPPAHDLEAMGMWGRRISDPNGISVIRTKVDGLKVRDIKCITKNHQTHNFFERFKWQVWEPPGTMIEMRTLKPIHTIGSDYLYYYGIHTFPRMRYFECNAPDITGYSAAVTAIGVIAIHSHRKDTDLAFYRDVDRMADRTTFWVYMPIDNTRGEYVKEIGRFMPRLDILYKNESHLPIGLTFTTNRGRTAVFGFHKWLTDGQRGEEDALLYARAYNPPRASTRIYFNESLKMRILACENPEPPTLIPLPGSVLPLEGFGDTLSIFRNGVYSSCSMSGVKSITLCYFKMTTLAGMLLEYEDGHKESMGQMRFDWTVQTIPITDPIYTKLRFTTEISSHNVSVKVTSLLDSAVPDGCTWSDIPFKGTMQLWLQQNGEICIHHCPSERPAVPANPV
ncbi:hypothetical protein F4804DRAFT_352833 [Jackrogersella minutella]|nr:hypothetical protein F4804DRAFT_352833 [Jackrogersella minutella]